jgi:hypothetical protein
MNANKVARGNDTSKKKTANAAIVFFFQDGLPSRLLLQTSFPFAIGTNSTTSGRGNERGEGEGVTEALP